MTKCGDIENQFTAYLDGLVGTEERKIVEEHLSVCPHCLRKLEELRKTREVLAGLDELDPPPGLTERIMSRIHEGQEHEGFFRKLFFPLHIKIPVQALATVFVVVLSVYIYKSTLPEMGSFEQPSSAPQVAQKGPPTAKKDIPPEKTSVPAPAQPSLRQAQPGKTEAARRRQTTAHPDVTERASPAAKNDIAAGYGGASTERALAPELHNDDVLQSSKAAPPPGAPQIKTRGMAVREEKSKAYQPGAMPPLRAASPDTRSRIAVISQNPGETAIQAKTIIRSLGGTRIEETTKNDMVIILAWIDTEVLGKLKDRLKEIASVDEPKSVFVSGPKSAVIEIAIRQTTDGREGKPADR